jgi:predicted transglutaminase-like cysteine proteinase
LFVEESELLNSREPHVAAWRESIIALRGRSAIEQLEGINAAANERVSYITDYEHWGVRERWGFPVEALEEGGDCEDIALLKMESLHLLGWPPERLFVLVGTSDLSGRTEGHAVLLVMLEDGSQLILDSVTPWIEPPGDDHHFFPLYAVNGEHYYKVAVRRPAS